jgi:hypothetical protein
VGRLRLHVRAAVFLGATRILLRWRGTTGTLRLLTRGSRSGRVHEQAALRAVRRAGRVVGGACLAQSVALTAVLEHSEQHPTLVLGCRPDDGTWTAHAWVVVNGQVLEPVRGEPHTALARLDRSTGWVPERVS